MRRSPKQEANRWFRQARADFKTADYLSKGEIYYFACFAYQQSAEKGLKAYFYAQGLSTVIGHSVHALCDHCARIDPAFRQLAGEVNGLDGYYIPTRYPNGLPDGIPADVYTLRDAQNSRQMCKLILDFVKSRI